MIAGIPGNSVATVELDLKELQMNTPINDEMEGRVRLTCPDTARRFHSSTKDTFRDECCEL